MATYMVEKPPLRVGASAVFPLDLKLQKKLRFTSRFGDEVLLHDVRDGELHVPRALAPVRSDDTVDETIWSNPVDYPKCPEPRPNQVEFFAEVDKIVAAQQSGVLVAYTGFGKTVVGFRIAARAQRRTLVVTTKDDIFKQWVNDAPKFLGISPNEVGVIRGPKCQHDRKIVVSMIHSLAKPAKYPPGFWKSFDVVVFDECHRLPAEQFSTVASLFPARIRLGLSATPERADGKDKVLHAHLGPIRAQTEAELMVPKVLVMKSQWECPLVRRRDVDTGKVIVKKLPHEPGKTMHLEKIVASDPVRNALIVEMAIAAFQKGRKVCVFSSLIDHLHSLQRAIVEQGVSGKEIGIYVGATTKAEKQNRDMAKARPLLLTTYTMMGEGTNLPWLDTCVLGMPRSNVAQPIGRIRREYPDKKDPVVIDIVDTDSPVFAGYAQKRAAWYNSIGANVIKY